MKTYIGKQIKKVFLLISTVMFLSMSVQAPVMAGMVTTDELGTQSQVELKRDQIRALMAREDIRGHLQENGVDMDDIDSRIDAMTDGEVLAFADQVEDLPAGGVLGAIIAILVIFMLLDIAGVTDIFPAI
jgi:hypothetical protein